jgi:uncharacterized spore protein YtfJ
VEDLNQFIDELGDSLGEIANSDLVVGSEIQLGEVTIVPLSQVGIGLGGGGGGGQEGGGKKKQSSTGSGGGTGGGGSVTPVAVAVFREGSVEILKVPTKPNALVSFLERVPDLIEKFKD